MSSSACSRRERGFTKMQLAAMNRVNVPENQRRDFFLYVDEFQNFATSSFVKILSEARKYRLCLTVANQYTAQVEEDVQKAIFGNVGTLMSFLVGSQDAKLLNLEFGNIYEESDLVNLDNFEIITKLSIDNKTSSPFPAQTLPLPKSINQNREKAIRLSIERYGKPRKLEPETLPQPETVEALPAGKESALKPQLPSPATHPKPVIPPPFQNDTAKTIPPIFNPAGHPEPKPQPPISATKTQSSISIPQTISQTGSTTPTIQARTVATPAVLPPHHHQHKPFENPLSRREQAEDDIHKVAHTHNPHNQAQADSGSQISPHHGNNQLNQQPINPHKKRRPRRRNRNKGGQNVTPQQGKSHTQNNSELE